MTAWTYILRCADGSYYVGCTTNLDQRMAQHGDGTLGGYTASRRPVELVWVDEFPDIHQAIVSSASSRAGPAPRRRR
jgi:predicted GIY-YIG superfamily endonuclease